MNDEEWLLKKIIERVGLTAVIGYIPPDVIQPILDEKRITDITGDLLTHMLAFTAAKDTISVMCVCKAWYAATRKRHFWKHRIRTKLASEILRFPNMLKGYKQELLLEFDTFASPVPETLREQVEWVFRKGWIEIDTTVDEKHRYVTRRTHGTGHCEQMITADGVTKLTNWYESSSPFLYSGRFVQAATEMSKSAARHYELKRYEDDVGTVLWKKDGLTYEGEGRRIGADGPNKRGDMMPHGDGKWTFADGTTLVGPGVAYKGEPRYIKNPN